MGLGLGLGLGLGAVTCRSAEHDAKKSPAGAKLHAVTAASCPLMVYMRWPSERSHTRSVLSSPDEMRTEPLGWNCRSVTTPLDGALCRARDRVRVGVRVRDRVRVRGRDRVRVRVEAL